MLVVDAGSAVEQQRLIPSGHSTLKRFDESATKPAKREGFGNDEMRAQIYRRLGDPGGSPSLASSGNKHRRFSYLLWGAMASGFDTFVFGGVVQSNSQRQVAVARAKLGLDCHLGVYHGRAASIFTYNGVRLIEMLRWLVVLSVPCVYHPPGLNDGVNSTAIRRRRPPSCR